MSSPSTLIIVALISVALHCFLQESNFLIVIVRNTHMNLIISHWLYWYCVPQLHTFPILSPSLSFVSAQGSSTLHSGQPPMRWNNCWSRSNTRLPPGWPPGAGLVSWVCLGQQPQVSLRLLDPHWSIPLESAITPSPYYLPLPARKSRWDHGRHILLWRRIYMRHRGRMWKKQAIESNRACTNVKESL